MLKTEVFSGMSAHDFPSPFRLCPACGSPDGEFLNQHRYHCPACQFQYFHNVACAAGVLVAHQDRFLFVERAQEPARGKLGLPGGFVDPGERVEETLVREVWEEIGGKIGLPCFLASFPNRYGFQDIWYHTCDFYFQAELLTPLEHLQPDPAEVSRIRWLTSAEVHADDLAFPSLRAMWSLRKTLQGEPPGSCCD